MSNALNLLHRLVEIGQHSEPGQDHGLVPDHGLVHEISGFLFKSVIFHKSN